MPGAPAAPSSPAGQAFSASSLPPSSEGTSNYLSRRIFSCTATGSRRYLTRQGKHRACKVNSSWESRLCHLQADPAPGYRATLLVINLSPAGHQPSEKAETATGSPGVTQMMSHRQFLQTICQCARPWALCTPHCWSSGRHLGRAGGRLHHCGNPLPETVLLHPSRRPEDLRINLSCLTDLIAMRKSESIELGCLD